MIGFIAFTVFVWFAGVAFGATVFVDWLHGSRSQAKPKPTIPLARALHNAQWKRLDIAPAKRRQRIQRFIDV